jgi:hypothetical protein
LLYFFGAYNGHINEHLITNPKWMTLHLICLTDLPVLYFRRAVARTSEPNCGGKFGLIRHYLHRKQFCSRRCQQIHWQKVLAQVRAAQFLAWLYQPP